MKNENAKIFRKPSSNWSKAFKEVQPQLVQMKQETGFRRLLD